MDASPTPAAPRDAANAAFAWLREAAWPLWLAHGVDWRRGGFRDNLDCDTLVSPADYRRLRVAARQTFVFAHAAAAGVPHAAEAVELGVDFLLTRARQADGGYARRFDLHNAVTDAARDLYDHAFVMLALAAAAPVTPGLRGEALALMGYLDAQFTHPQGGFLESLPGTLPRRQNPHMHMLEACLAAAEVFGAAVFLTRAEGLVRLFLTRFYDPAGGLPELYDQRLAPLAQAGRYVMEPGHLCEWVWLLDWFGRLAPGVLTAELDAAAAGLTRTIDRIGLNPATGAAYDGVWNDGGVVDAGSRLWPQTERLKLEILRPDATPDSMLRAFAVLDRFVAREPRGLWYERLAQDGTPVREPAPASSLYHLTAGILFARRRLA